MVDPRNNIEGSEGGSLRYARKPSRTAAFSLSTLLNLIDGVPSLDGVFLIIPGRDDREDRGNNDMPTT